MRSRVLDVLLLGLIAPGTLLAFLLVFRADSYQYWGDKYHIVLSSQYLFSRQEGTSVLEPLWREDLMAGSPWLISLGTAPFMLDTLLARLFHLSPVGIDLVSNVLGYAVAAGAMYLYLRRAISLTAEGAVAGSILFAASGSILSTWTGCANDLLITGLLPALLLLCHRVRKALAEGGGRRVVVPWVGLAVMTYAASVASSLKTLPIMLVLVAAYVVCVFRASRPVLLAASAVLVGLVLYSPWLALFWDAVRTSQRVSSTFVPAAAFDPGALAAAALVVIRRLASGFNVYGVTMPLMLAVVASLVGYRETLKRALPTVRPVILFSAAAFGFCFVMDAFSAQVNDLKKAVPLVGGYDVVRFEWFAAFFGLVPAAWVLDRGVGSLEAAVDSPVRARAARIAVLVVAVLGAIQAVHIARRTLTLSAIPPAQGFMLKLFGVLFLATSAALAALTYRAIGPGSTSQRRWWLGLLSLSVLFQASILGYRHGVDMTGRMPGNDPPMTYSERFAVPDDIALLKQAGGSVHRVVDLTRPYDRVLTTAASTVLPLAGLRTPIGYLNLFPRQYDRFIALAVNGSAGPPSRWVEIREGPTTNFAALQLLDVKYVLARDGTDLPGYTPWLHHGPTGKMIYRAGPEVGPAFLSPERVCVPSDDDALTLIRDSDYQALVGRAILVSSDEGVQGLCQGLVGETHMADGQPSRVEVTRKPDRVTVEVAAQTGGILTLADIYYPGWQALVDGREVPILRTYTTLRGVSVGAGRHTVEFVYAPETFWSLFWISNGLLAVLLAAVVWSARSCEGSVSGSWPRGVGLKAGRVLERG